MLGMRSSKLAFFGLLFAAVLIVFNVFALRLFSDSVRSALTRDKARIVSRFSVPRGVNNYDEGEVLSNFLDFGDAKSEPPSVVSAARQNINPVQPVTESLADVIHRTLPRMTTTTIVPPPKQLPEATPLLDEISAPANMSCHLMVKFGRDENREFGHETWRLCFDDPYKIGKPCIVYSFGIAYDFSFDDDLAKFGCQVYSFDPSMLMPAHKRDSGVMFFNIGIARRDSFNYQPELNAFNNKTSWTVKSLRSIRKNLKHEDVILDVVKLDVEGMEWISLDQAISDGVLEKTRYLLLELHVCAKDFNSTAKVELARRVYHQLSDIGFIKYFSDPWTTDPINNCRMVLNYFIRPASFVQNLHAAVL